MEEYDARPKKRFADRKWNQAIGPCCNDLIAILEWALDGTGQVPKPPKQTTVYDIRDARRKLPDDSADLDIIRSLFANNPQILVLLQ